jgi:hypothetical protein
MPKTQQAVEVMLGRYEKGACSGRDNKKPASKEAGFFDLFTFHKIVQRAILFGVARFFAPFLAFAALFLRAFFVAVVNELHIRCDEFQSSVGPRPPPGLGRFFFGIGAVGRFFGSHNG